MGLFSSPELQNDQGCGWTNLLPQRQPTPPLQQSIKTDWLVIGAGYTGLACAHKLAELHPNEHIVLVDGMAAGEGASARNSGYLVDSTLNDGHMSDSGLKAYREKYELNLAGIHTTEKLVKNLNISCDWNPCGKFHATSLEANEEKLRRFSATLTECDIQHQLIESPSLNNRLGTGYYRMAVHTNGGVLLQPAALARGLTDTLPRQINLYEMTRVTGWQKQNGNYRVQTDNGHHITAKQVILAVNGFMPSLGVKKNRVFPLTLTASLTRPLTDLEFSSIGSPDEWGVLSAQGMGATVRLTSDRRIMIRNTAELWPAIAMSDNQLQQRVKIHIKGIQRRFPALPDNIIEHSWSGITCISQNNANIFEQLADRLWTAGCYNGGGIGLALLFGEQIALKASGADTAEIQQIEARPKASWLPPQPFLNLGVTLKLARDRAAAEPER